MEVWNKKKRLERSKRMKGKRVGSMGFLWRCRDPLYFRETCALLPFNDAFREFLSASWMNSVDTPQWKPC